MKSQLPRIEIAEMRETIELKFSRNRNLRAAAIFQIHMNSNEQAK